jgi:hypothetical protein
MGCTLLENTKSYTVNLRLGAAKEAVKKCLNIFGSFVQLRGFTIRYIYKLFYAAAVGKYRISVLQSFKGLRICNAGKI